jgi:glycosyltransferase involved in cell wall biosynthesis
VSAENPRLAPIGKIYGYPIDFATLSQGSPAAIAEQKPIVNIGYVGRIHQEKGIAQLVEALRLLADRPELPKWKVTFCGPVDVARGGSGEGYLAPLLQALEGKIGSERVEVLPPQFEAENLAQVYRSLDVFVLPSLSEKGETFGVAAVEAMAAGCAVVTSDLSCFRDYLDPGNNGLRYDHRATNASALLADSLARLISSPDLRTNLATEGVETARRYDFEKFGHRLLGDFERILAC